MSSPGAALPVALLAWALVAPTPQDDDHEAPVRQPRARNTSDTRVASWPRTNKALSRTPWLTGYSPVRIEAWDASVIGAGAMADSKRTPSRAIRSSVGVAALA